MPNLELLTHSVSYKGEDRVILRPCITLALYSSAKLTEVMAATAGVITEYLEFIPSNSILTTFQPGVDEYSPGSWLPFDDAMRIQLIAELRAGYALSEEDGYGFVLSATTDGQAGDYGISFGGVEICNDDDENETSLLRLNFPLNFFDTTSIEALVNFIECVSGLFPYCCGNAGMSFNYTVSWVPEAREKIHKLLVRFIGFDSAHDSAQLEMRGKSPSAHWINILDYSLIKALGGEDKLIKELGQCEVKRLANGLLIRAASFPPIADLNRGALDIGCMPVVAKVLKPIRFCDGLFAGLEDAETGNAWLERFDNLQSKNWDNS